LEPQVLWLMDLRLPAELLAPRPVGLLFLPAVEKMTPQLVGLLFLPSVEQAGFRQRVGK
jgi:hypothetical protein